MNKLIVAIYLIALSVIPLQKTRAFWSFSIYQDHQDITKATLSAPNPNPYCFSTNNCYYFSPKAVDQIKAVNQVVDAPANYKAPNQFDNSSFVASINQMATYRGQLNTLLSGAAPGGAFIPSNPNFPRMQLQAWQIVGYMLHAAQDFYAHSTWVDEGNTNNIVGFGALTDNTSKPNTNIPLGSAPSSGIFCAQPKGYPLVGPVTFTVTGYYPPINHPPGACEHGLTTALTTTSLVSVCVTGGIVPGISHDAHGCAATNRRYFDLASRPKSSTRTRSDTARR